jgi:uncharacterized protein YndB with AHSA1/START domain
VKPITVSTTVPQPREEVYAFLDVLGNHEPFTNHMLVDWTLSGPPAGVGAKARMRANSPGPKQWADMEVLEGVAPERIVEEAVGANGRRRTRGTYTLLDAPGGGTEVRFTFEYLEAPASERLMMPFLRAYLRRGNQKAMERLHETLAARERAAAPAA